MTAWPENAMFGAPLSGMTAMMASAIRVEDTRMIAGMPR